MGRLIYGTPSDRVEPPEEDFDITIECPECGRELHEGDRVYQIYKKGSPTIIACEYCIDDLADFVEDL